MPRFLTEAELRTEFGEAAVDRLADRDNDGMADPDLLEKVILDAEDEALSRLYNRFSDSEIPSTPETTSRYLKLQIAGLAYRHLHKHYDPVPQKAVDLGTAAWAALGAIQAGQLSAVLTGQPTVDAARPIVVAVRRSTSLSDQPITLESMESWGRGRSRW